MRMKQLLVGIGVWGAVLCIWIIPVLLMGSPPEVPYLLRGASVAEGGFVIKDHQGAYLPPHQLSERGILDAGDGRLTTLLIHFFGQFISWDAWVSWTVLSTVCMALSITFLWIAVRKLFGTEIAWVSAVFMALTPLYVREALQLNYYTFGYVFFFASCAVAALLYKRSPHAAFLVSGVLLALAALCKDIFLLFLPPVLTWMLWHQRTQWKKGLLHCTALVVLIGSIYTIPYLTDIRDHGYPSSSYLSRIFPGGPEDLKEQYFYDHLYPDPYTYHYNRETFESDLLREIDTWPLLRRLRISKLLLNFSVGDPGFLDGIINGTWILLNSLFGFLMVETFGGVVFVGLFIAGCAALWKKHRSLIIASIGTLVFVHLFLAYVLHFNRSHLMDVGFLVVIPAAAGTLLLRDKLSTVFSKLGKQTLTWIIVAILSLQLLQADRYLLSRLYRSSVVDRVHAHADIISDISPDAVIASPIHSNEIQSLVVLARREMIVFAPQTITTLLEQHRLGEAFQQYRVTHITGYSTELSNKIVRALPQIETLESPQHGKKSINLFTEYLIHLLR